MNDTTDKSPQQTAPSWETLHRAWQKIGADCVGLNWGDFVRATDAAVPQQVAPAEPSPTAGMNIAQRILHVGGRTNEAGYVEFGSIQAVEALVRQVLRDLPEPKPQQAAQALPTKAIETRE